MTVETMSKPQQERYLHYIRDYRKDKIDYCSTSDSIKFKRFDKRLAPLQKKLDNVFSLSSAMQHYFNGEYLHDSDTFTAYIFLNYKKTQITLSQVLTDMGEYCIYHYDEFQRVCNGMTCNYPNEFYATFTLGLDSIDIKF